MDGSDNKNCKFYVDCYLKLKKEKVESNLLRFEARKNLFMKGHFFSVLFTSAHESFDVFPSSSFYIFFRFAFRSFLYFLCINEIFTVAPAAANWVDTRKAQPWGFKEADG